MKTFRYLFILLMAVCGLPLSAQAQKAVIACENSSYDFGTIREADGDATHTFTLKNEGDAPLVITNATATCGCTTPVWTKEPIQSGKTGTVSVTFNPKNRPGKFVKTVSVYSNGMTKGVFRLTIRGVVEAAETAEE